VARAKENSRPDAFAADRRENTARYATTSTTMDRGAGGAKPCAEDDMLRPVTAQERRVIALVATCCALWAPAAVRADPPAGDSAAVQAGAAPDTAFTTYSFEDDKVVGDTAQPMGEVLTVRARPGRASLIRAREHFVRELLKSVEAL
jgi:hypothetical protein